MLIEGAVNGRELGDEGRVPRVKGGKKICIRILIDVGSKVVVGD
jgi:hypothetical protein